MPDSVRAITLHQPYASLVALGVKRIETRSWKCPDSMIGQNLLIHAGKGKADWNDPVWQAMESVGLMERGVSTFGPMRPGVLLASCKVVACIPMVLNDDPRPHPSSLVLDCPDDGDLDHQRGGMWMVGSNPLTNGRPTFIEDQRPWGDFAPGRWAWLLDEITPLAEPIPVKGKQGLWRYTPEPAAPDVSSFT